MKLHNKYSDISSADHTKFMAQAIRLARLGEFTTMPNPRVGCVIVKNGEVIAVGWHEKAGSGHAEVNAIRNAHKSVIGATAYVTLEPCSHIGKTPPCCNLLIEHGIETVVVGMNDPNPLVAGAGIKKLENAGVKVISGVMEQEARCLNPGFIKRMKQGMPYVSCKMIMSLNARIAVGSDKNEWITNNKTRHQMQRLRAKSCAIVVSAESVINDGSMNIYDNRFDEFSNLDKVAAKLPLRVIVDSELHTLAGVKLLALHGTTLIVTAVKKTSRTQALEQQSTEKNRIQCLYLPGEDGKVDLTTLLRQLADRHCNEVFIDADDTLMSSFLQQQLINELNFFMTPSLMGNQAEGLSKLKIQSLIECPQLHINYIYPVGRIGFMKASANLETCRT